MFNIFGCPACCHPVALQYPFAVCLDVFLVDRKQLLGFEMSCHFAFIRSTEVT